MVPEPEKYVLGGLAVKQNVRRGLKNSDSSGVFSWGVKMSRSSVPRRSVSLVGK